MIQEICLVNLLSKKKKVFTLLRFFELLSYHCHQLTRVKGHMGFTQSQCSIRNHLPSKYISSVVVAYYIIKDVLEKKKCSLKYAKTVTAPSPVENFKREFKTYPVNICYKKTHCLLCLLEALLLLLYISSYV